MAAPSSQSPTAVRSVALCFLAAAGCGALAVWRQDFGSALPLGLFNEGREVYSWIAGATLAALGFSFALFALELARGRRVAAAAIARGLIVAFAVTEILVTLVDVGLVSRGGGAGLGGPYREVESAAGTRVFLKRPHAGSPLGFRTDTPYAKKPAGRRVLFLGDSYTEGSGRQADCNYPDVAISVLRAHGGDDWEGMNAGVAGYGPEESLALLRFLTEEGYEFEAVVLGLFLENDFTDDLPGTERRVVAGINFRFPRSPFLRWLHPLNSRTFRYVVFLARASRLRAVSDDAVQRGDGQCRRPPPLPDPLPRDLESVVRRRLDANYGLPPGPLALGVVEETLEQFARTTGEIGSRGILVVFPDRILADADLRARLGADHELRDRDLERLRRWLREHRGTLPLVDVTEALAGPAVHYRNVDTHLSDEGNRVAGRYVGERLAELLTGEPRSSDSPSR
jgi:hypothetical protein